MQKINKEIEYELYGKFGEKRVKKRRRKKCPNQCKEQANRKWKKTLIARFLNETNDEDEKKKEKKSGNGKWGEYYDHWAFNGLDSAVTCMLMGLKYYTFTNTSK